jgi:hypothetical protein
MGAVGNHVQEALRVCASRGFICQNAQVFVDWGNRAMPLNRADPGHRQEFLKKGSFTL